MSGGLFYGGYTAGGLLFLEKVGRWELKQGREEIGVGGVGLGKTERMRIHRKRLPRIGQKGREP